MKLNLKTTKYYPVPPSYSGNWTEEDWERTAVYRTEPKKIRAIGYVWRTLGERNAKGELLYLRAEKE